jgi:hypothetical protein
MINPKTHPRRYSAHIERQQAERGRALASALTAAQAASRMGITTMRAEQLAAKHGYAYQPPRKAK